MGLPILPDELMLSLLEQWQCRETQIRQLNALYSPHFSSPATIAAYGPKATGKSSVVQSYFEKSKLLHAYIKCKECITGRHLLERTVSTVSEALQQNDHSIDTKQIERCENLSVLVAHLQRVLKGKEKFVLIFDGVDEQREAQPTLIPALARLGEFIPNLSTLLILRHPTPHHLHATGIPHIHFQPYTRQQSLHILSQTPPEIFLTPPSPSLNYDTASQAEDKAWLYPRFCAAVWDSIAQNAARDLVSFREVCEKLWRPFVAPIVSGEFGTRDFSRLLVRQRALFQDEGVLLHSIVPGMQTQQGKEDLLGKGKHELPYYAKWVLIAAYLASFNPVKTDALYFMKSTERKRRKKGGGTAKAGGRASQTRKVARHLLAPSAFTLDRLLAILHAVLPHDLRTTIDVYTQIATLTSLRLLVRGGSLGSADPLEPGGKWRTGSMVTWEFTQTVARSLRFDLVDYVAE